MNKPYSFFTDPIFGGIDIVFGREIYNRLLKKFNQKPADYFPQLEAIRFKVSDIVEEDTMIGVSETGRRIVEDIKKLYPEESS